MTSNKIFLKPVPNHILFDLLEKICLKKEKYYIVDINCFRKMVFHNLHIPFINAMKEYYHKSKQFYATRKFTYNSFTNIIRQICRNNNIIHTSSIKYCESDYNIEYNIYL